MGDTKDKIIIDEEWEELLQMAIEIDKAEMKRKAKKRNLFQRLFKPTPEEIMDRFSMKF